MHVMRSVGAEAGGDGPISIPNPVLRNPPIMIAGSAKEVPGYDKKK